MILYTNKLSRMGLKQNQIDTIEELLTELFSKRMAKGLKREIRKAPTRGKKSLITLNRV